MAWPGHQALFAVQGVPAHSELDAQQKANAVFMVRSGAQPEKAVEDAKKMNFQAMVPMPGLPGLPQTGFSIAGMPMTVPNSNIHPMYSGMMMQPVQAFPEQQQPPQQQHQSNNHHHHHYHSHHHQHHQQQQQHQSVHRPQSAYSQQSQPRQHHQQSQYSHQTHQQQQQLSEQSSHQLQQHPTASSTSATTTTTSTQQSTQKASTPTAQTKTTPTPSSTSSTTAATGSTARKASWLTYEDPSSGREYYYNPVTKEKQWEKPLELRGGNEWQAFEDPKSKRIFYYNQSTGDKQWECPAEFAAQKAKKEKEEEEAKKKSEKEERDRIQQQQLEKERREKAAAAEEAAQEEMRRKAQQQAVWEKARAMQNEVVPLPPKPEVVKEVPVVPPSNEGGINVSELFSQVARQAAPPQPATDSVMDKMKSAVEAASKPADTKKEDFFVKQLLQMQANRHGLEDESEDPHRLAKQEQRRQQREKYYGDVEGSNNVREAFGIGLGLSKKEKKPERLPRDNFNNGNDDEWRNDRQEARDKARREWNANNSNSNNNTIATNGSGPRGQNGSPQQIKPKNSAPNSSPNEKVKVKMSASTSPQNKPALTLRLGDHVVFTREVSRGNKTARQGQHGTIKIVDIATGVYHVELNPGTVIGGLHPSFVELAKKQLREKANNSNSNSNNKNLNAQKIVMKSAGSNSNNNNNNSNNNASANTNGKVQVIVAKSGPPSGMPIKTKLTASGGGGAPRSGHNNRQGYGSNKNAEGGKASGNEGSKKIVVKAVGKNESTNGGKGIKTKVYAGGKGNRGAPQW